MVSKIIGTYYVSILSMSVRSEQAKIMYAVIHSIDIKIELYSIFSYGFGMYDSPGTPSIVLRKDWN